MHTTHKVLAVKTFGHTPEAADDTAVLESSFHRKVQAANIAANERGLAITDWGNVSEAQARWMQYEIQRKGHTFSTYSGWLFRPPAPSLSDIPDPHPYYLRSVYFLNPIHDPEMKTAYGAMGMTCEKGHPLSVVGPVQGGPRFVRHGRGAYLMGVRLRDSICGTEISSTAEQTVKSMPSIIRNRIPIPDIGQHHLLNDHLLLRVQRASKCDGDSMAHVAECNHHAQLGDFFQSTLQYLEHCVFYASRQPDGMVFPLCTYTFGSAMLLWCNGMLCFPSRCESHVCASWGHGKQSVL